MTQHVTHPHTPGNINATELNAGNFITEVMDASLAQIVVVDFWAPWCGPCQQLAPILDKVITDTNGAAKLTTIDIDQHAQIAQQLRVQSVPTIFAFFNRQLIDGFMGVLPENQIREWLNELIKHTGAKAPSSAKDQVIEEALARGQAALEADDPTSAKDTFEAILEESPEHLKAYIGLLHSLLALGQHEQAAEKLAVIPPSLSKEKALIPLRTAIELAQEAKQSATQTDAAPLRNHLEINADDHQARFDFALSLYANNDPAGAIEQLLNIVKRDRAWREDAARLQLLKIFEALGHDHPLTVEGRKHLSTMLFS